MKKSIFGLPTLIALLIAVFSFTACADKKDLTVTDCAFTSFTAQDFDGNIVDETVFKGYKVTMINVWGTYCAPCKTELPELAELNTEYKNSGFQIIGIPIDANYQTATDAKQLIEETQANYRHLKISTSLKGFISGIKSVPYTTFVNENGQQLGEGYYGAKSKADWKKIIEEMPGFVNE